MERKLFKIDCDKITNGSNLFKDCKNLTKFNSDLSSLTNSTSMFYGCSALTSFTSNLSSLTNGYEMFRSCDNLTSFGSDLSSLTNGSHMFQGSNLKSFYGNLANLADGYEMFRECQLNAASVKHILDTIPDDNTGYKQLHLGVSRGGFEKAAEYLGIASGSVVDASNATQYRGWGLYLQIGSQQQSTVEGYKYKGCTNLDEIKAKDFYYVTSDIADGVWTELLCDLSYGSYQSWGTGMFYLCNSLTAFSSDLSNLYNGGYMFQGCDALTYFDADLSDMYYGDMMFYHCSHLTSFSSNLSSLTDGTDMFYYCINLESFSSDLSSLTDGQGMFHTCKLTSFSSDLSSLQNAYAMFARCYNLESFTSDLSNLAYGEKMFYYSTLESFSSDLSSLIDGYRMFYKCKLNTASVQNIADTINTYNGTINIDIANSTPNTQEKAAFNKIASKGWSVYVNGGSYYPTSASQAMTLDENGIETTTPIPYYAKPVQATEETALYVDNDGNYYNILGAQFIYGDDLSTYGMFVSEEDAAANMRLIKYTKTEE